MISPLPNQTSLLMESAIRSCMLALAVWIGLRLFRVRDVFAQKATWGVVLAAALTMPIVLPMVAHWSVLPANVRVVIPADPQTLLEELQARMQAKESPNVTASAASPTAEAGPQDQKIAETLPPETSVNRAADAVEFDSSGDKAASYLKSQPAPQPEAGPSLAAVPHRAPMSMMAIALLLYFSVAVVLLVRVAWGILAAARLLRTATPIAMDSLVPLVESFDLPGSGKIRCSTRIASPVTIFSSILLPADFLDWDSEKLRIVLAHERSHIRQGDFYLQLLTGIYAAVVWFSPLGWWLKRKLSDLAEAISDRAGLEEAADRTSYAQILLQFAATPRPTVIGVAMARSGSLSRRIERLLNDVSFRQAFSGTRRSLAAVLVIPLALFAATALLRVEAAGQQTPAAPEAPAMPAAPTAGMQAPSLPPAVPDEGAPIPDPAIAPAAPTAEPSTPEEVSTEPVLASPPALAIAPPAQAGVPEPATPAPPAHISGPAVLMIAPPAAPHGGLTILAPKALRGPGSASMLILPPSAPGSRARLFAIVPRAGEGQSTTTESGSSSHSENGRHSGYHYSYSSNGQSYAVVRGNDADHMTFSGDWIEGRRDEIEKARKQAHGDFLWFTRDGKSYVVDDPATLAQIDAMYKPMEDLGRQQEELGKKQEALGELQEALGKQQEAVSVPTPDMSKQIAEIDEAMAKLKAEQGKNMNQEQFAEIQEKLGALQGRLGEMQGKLGSRQGEFGAKMGELGAKMGELGAQQGRLGAEQGRLGREADQKVKSIIDESLKNGKAKPVQ